MRSLTAVVLGLVVAGTPLPILANGRAMPKLTRVTLHATCIERGGAERREIFSTKVATGDELSTTLTVRQGASVEEVSLHEIATLLILGDKVDSKGFVQAALGRVHGNTVDVKVQVVSNGEEVVLDGFTKEGARIRVPLLRCRHLSLTVE